MFYRNYSILQLPYTMLAHTHARKCTCTYMYTIYSIVYTNPIQRLYEDSSSILLLVTWHWYYQVVVNTLAVWVRRYRREREGGMKERGEKDWRKVKRRENMISAQKIPSGCTSYHKCLLSENISYLRPSSVLGLHTE